MTEPDFQRATRASYDAVAADYAERFASELAARPLDRAMLSGFAELVRAAGGGPVADIGCGTGRVTAYLYELGLSVTGIDLSPKMVEVARQLHPGLRFDVGSMLMLQLPDAALAGIVAWYSIIHLPPERLPEVFAGFRRALAPGGFLLLAFQVGDEPMSLTQALGRAVELRFHRLRPARVAELLTRAGLTVRAELHREPDVEGDFPERTPQAFMIARRPRSGG